MESRINMSHKCRQCETYELRQKNGSVRSKIIKNKLCHYLEMTRVVNDNTRFVVTQVKKLYGQSPTQVAKLFTFPKIKSTPTRF